MRGMDAKKQSFKSQKWGEYWGNPKILGCAERIGLRMMIFETVLPKGFR